MKALKISRESAQNSSKKYEKAMTVQVGRTANFGKVSSGLQLFRRSEIRPI